MFFPSRKQLAHFSRTGLRFAYVIVALCQILRRLVLHVSQHRVGAGLAEEVGDGRVLPPHGEVQRRAAVEHGGVDVGAVAEQQLHRGEVVQLHGEMKSRFPTGSFLGGTQTNRTLAPKGVVSSQMIFFATGKATSVTHLELEA